MEVLVQDEPLLYHVCLEARLILIPNLLTRISDVK